jgi:acyl phosphate:glycerol-3-phosphate acyltransferase
MIAERLRVYIHFVPSQLAVLFLPPLQLQAISIIVAFLLGSIPFGLIIARAHGVDIRSVGSGNIGMTNVWRTLGWKAGLAVFILDVLKGWLPVFLVALYLQTNMAAYVQNSNVLSVFTTWSHIPIVTGLAAVLGHTFTPWLRFKGGKGVATGLGVAIGLYQMWILAPLAVFLLTLFIRRTVSLSSVLAALVIGALAFLVPELELLRAFGVLVALLILYTHRGNIRRILNGTENKVSFGRRRNHPSPSPSTPDP